MAVLPREEDPSNPRRLHINEKNKKIDVFANENNITVLNIGKKMLTTDRKLPKEIAGDFCHPTEKGYQIWADSLRPYISEP